LPSSQIAGGYPDAIARTCQLIEEMCPHVDFVDINCGCPIDLVSAPCNEISALYKASIPCDLER